MLNSILQELETVFGDQDLVDIPEQQWAAYASHFAALLDDLTVSLTNIAENTFSTHPYQHSTREQCLYRRPHWNVCNIEIKPKEESIGLRASTSLYRSIDRYPANLGLKLEIWGHEALQGFRTLFRSYRRPVETLLRTSNLEFETGDVLERLKGYRGKDPIKKLDLYFSEALTDNDGFDLEAEYFNNTSPDILVDTFLALTALYDSSYYYSSKKKDFDKILKYYNVMRARRRKNHATLPK